MMGEQSFSAADIFRLIRTYGWIALLTTLLFTALSVLVAFKLPKSFKSKAVLNIQAGYFQNPLIQDLVSTSQNPAELRAQRSSLLRLALSDSFLDKLGEKYGVFEYPAKHRMRVMERERFLKKIEYFSLNPTTFQISVIGDSPQSAYAMTSEVLAQMKTTLISERYAKLITTRDAIQKHINALEQKLNPATEAKVVQPNQVQLELEQIRQNLDLLLKRYTEKHPDVVKLKRRKEILEEGLEQQGISKVDQQPATDLMLNNQPLSKSSEEPAQDLYADLLHKLGYLKIVLDMERDRENVSYLGVIEQPTIPTKAFSPKKRVIVAIGFFLGLFVSAIFILFEELRRISTMSPQNSSDVLGVPFLGELPPMHAYSGLRLIEGPEETQTQRSLPAPAA